VNQKAICQEKRRVGGCVIQLQHSCNAEMKGRGGREIYGEQTLYLAKLNRQLEFIVQGGIAVSDVMMVSLISFSSIE